MTEGTTSRSPTSRGAADTDARSNRPLLFAWREALRTSSLTSTQRHVALAMSTYMDADGSGAWPSLTTLARDTARKKRTVMAAIQELVEQGWVDRRSGGGRLESGAYRSTRYTAVLPSSSAPSGTDVPDDTDAVSSTDAAERIDAVSATVPESAGTVPESAGTVHPAAANGAARDPLVLHEEPPTDRPTDTAADDDVEDKETAAATAVLEEICAHLPNGTLIRIREDADLHATAIEAIEYRLGRGWLPAEIVTRLTKASWRNVDDPGLVLRKKLIELPVDPPLPPSTRAATDPPLVQLARAYALAEGTTEDDLRQTYEWSAATDDERSHALAVFNAHPSSSTLTPVAQGAAA